MGLQNIIGNEGVWEPVPTERSRNNVRKLRETIINIGTSSYFTKGLLCEMLDLFCV